MALKLEDLPKHINNLLSTASVGGVSLMVVSHRIEGEAPKRSLLLDIQVTSPANVDIWPALRPILKPDSDWGGGEIVRMAMAPLRTFRGFGGMAIRLTVRIEEEAAKGKKSEEKIVEETPTEATGEATEEVVENLAEDFPSDEKVGDSPAEEGPEAESTKEDNQEGADKKPKKRGRKKKSE